MFRTVEDETVDGRTMHLEGKPFVTFGSGSYLGLELRPELREGAIEATRRYGTQFPSSRAYVSAPLYAELEALLEQIFGAPALVAQNTSMAHQNVLPILIDERDAVILDQQVHFSVQYAVNQVRLQGTTVEMIRHNRMDQLEDAIRRLAPTHRKIWYLADGVYSMFGDLTPIDSLARLLASYGQLHLYLDDAHGMSWYGPRGKGYALTHLPTQERVIVSLSLNKSFAAAGGAIVIPDPELRRRVMLSSGPMIYSGPIQPPMLGAAVASARLHLTPVLDALQKQLHDRISLCNRLLDERQVPIVAPTTVPIRFVGLGLPEAAFRTSRAMLDDGFFLNTATFPLIPMRQAGLRFTVTALHEERDVRAFADALAKRVFESLAAERISIEEVRERFGIAAPAGALAPGKSKLTLEQATSIEAIDRREWDGLLGARGSFTWEGLRMLERVFQDRPEPENQWSFHYYIVRDEARRPVLATFFTEALWKDDMLSPIGVSKMLEEKRHSAPYYLTSRVLSMGSLLTEGDHLYLDRSGDWRAALSVLINAVTAQLDRSSATRIVLRDFPASDGEFEQEMLRLGYVRYDAPETYVARADWADEASFLASLSRSSRGVLRDEVLSLAPRFQVTVLSSGDRLTPEESARVYALYRNVHARSFAINTFPLPVDFFDRLLENPGWEVVLLRVPQEHGGPADGLPIGAFASFTGGADQYVPLALGLDYAHVESLHVYRQALWQAVLRARALGRPRVLFGMTAGLEKKRFGSEPEPRCVYAQASEHFQLEVLAQEMADAAVPRK